MYDLKSIRPKTSTGKTKHSLRNYTKHEKRAQLHGNANSYIFIHSDALKLSCGMRKCCCTYSESDWIRMSVCVRVYWNIVYGKSAKMLSAKWKKSKEEFFWGYYESCDWRDCHVFGSSAFVSVRSHFLHQQFRKAEKWANSEIDERSKKKKRRTTAERSRAHAFSNWSRYKCTLISLNLFIFPLQFSLKLTWRCELDQWVWFKLNPNPIDTHRVDWESVFADDFLLRNFFCRSEKWPKIFLVVVGVLEIW